MKIAIPCPGLEHVQRGFETYSRELFGALKPHGDVHLIKASGEKRLNVHVVPALRRTSPLLGMLPGRWQTEYRRGQIECWTFALGMLPLLCREKFDVIHFSEAPLGDALKWLRQRFGFGFRLLFSNGGPWPPWDCARFDAVHQVSPAHEAAGREYGIQTDRSFLVPYGIDGARLSSPQGWNRADARRALDLPENAFVVLSLAALNRHHKRVDWLIREFSKIRGAFQFLILAGNRERETDELEALAAQLLPDKNFRFIHLSYEEVPNLLWVSDVLVQCSLDEGFGRVLTEAMGASVPLLAHPYLTARWIIDNSDCMIDMTIENLLADKLQELSQNPSACKKMAAHNLNSFHRFEWKVLIPDYLAMYKRVNTLS